MWQDLEAHEVKEALDNIKVWQTKWVGQHVTRYFKEGRKMVPYRALVKEYFQPEDKGDLPLWHIQHEDGDEEDLEEQEVREGLANDLKAEKERKRQAAAAARAEESDGDDDDERNGTLWPGKLERKRWRDCVGAPQPSAPTLALCLAKLLDHFVGFGVCRFAALASCCSLVTKTAGSVDRCEAWAPGSNAGAKANKAAQHAKKQKKKGGARKVTNAKGKGNVGNKGKGGGSGAQKRKRR